MKQYIAEQARLAAADAEYWEKATEEALLDAAKEIHELDHLESYGIGIGMCLLGSRTKS